MILLSVRKNDVWFCLINKLVDILKTFWVWCSMSVRSKPKFRWLSSITNKWKFSSLFDVNKMILRFVWCSIKWCSTHHWFLSHIGVNFLGQNVSNKAERGLEISLKTIFQPLSDSVIYSAIESVRAPQSREAIHRAAVFCIILARLKVSNSGNNFLISSRPKIAVVCSLWVECWRVRRVPTLSIWPRSGVGQFLV